MSLINTQVQPFKTEAFHNGKFVTVSDETLKGKWSVLIFMPAAFTFNCPTEVEDAADNYAEFQKMGAEVYIVTTDTHFSHKVWHETSPAVGGTWGPHVARNARSRASPSTSRGGSGSGSQVLSCNGPRLAVLNSRTHSRMPAGGVMSAPMAPIPPAFATATESVPMPEHRSRMRPVGTWMAMLIARS